MRKGQAIGQLCLDSTKRFGAKIAIGLLENLGEPQATQTEQPFVTSIFAIEHVSLPVMDTAPP